LHYVHSTALNTHKKNTGTPRLKDEIHNINSRAPVILFKITWTNKNTKHFDISGSPVKVNGRVRTPRPASEPKTLRLGIGLAEDPRPFEQGIRLKNSFDSIIRRQDERSVIRVL